MVTVITSYSIHYTKLYDEYDSAKALLNPALQHARIANDSASEARILTLLDESAQVLPIAQQLQARAKEADRARRYLAYFQAYTSTYAEVAYLKQMYEEALGAADMVGLCVGTRPDCVPDAVLDLLAGYQAQGFEISYNFV